MKKSSDAKTRPPAGTAPSRPAKAAVPRPGGGAKAFIQQQQLQQRKLAAAAAKTSDSGSSSDGGLPLPMLKAARASGQLNLSNRGLQAVPDKVWRLNEPDEKKKGFGTDVVPDQEEENWWEYVDLTKLILASNQITSLSKDVELLAAGLTVLDLHDNALTSLPDEIGR